MKRLNILPLLASLALFLVGFVNLATAQDVKLPEIRVTAVNYKYLSALDKNEVSEPVKLLRREAAAYDIRTSSVYEDDYDNYSISFEIPQGKILATYDENGKLLRTAERFTNTALPPAVAKAVVTKYPGWKIAKDVYLVSYSEPKGAKKKYKITLENGDKRMKVKTDENGQFL
ncbi:nicotinate-nucleotide adenylyltransferase [Rufibacter radiotolerans]|uniref:Nicotinate-nucleotide adenylyltransferase n=1 Tax=Rufibacter radiotolerans TaxID=1379910 RepID=A0A0H4W7C6_9BACT|nr:PepSY-like domain-containing protein [Rufibacter radiotolerans]AKQ46336.1 nicotinate-nucleotide adenylyltransferase [Rufibacter radiotolerans]